MAVQGFCDHLEAVNQHEHLFNSMLLVELVKKLPPHIIVDWALHTQNHFPVNLKAFRDFTNEIMKLASQVTLYFGVSSRSEEKPKPKGCVVHCHSVEVKNIGAVENKKHCLDCKSMDYLLKDYTVFKSYNLDERWNFVNNRGI